MDKNSYSGVFVLVGRDWKFGLAACEILVSEGVSIRAIFGSTAEDVFASLKNSYSHSYDLSKVHVSNANRPWLDDDMFSRSLDTGLLGISAGFDYLVPQWCLEKNSFVNLHPSFLPFNRGCHQSFWAIMDETPKGGSIHWMDRNFDSGPVIASKMVEDDGFLTAEALQAASKSACLLALKETIADILSGGVAGTFFKGGSLHGKSEIVAASSIAENANLSGLQLWNLVRATKHTDHGFYLEVKGKKIKIKCEISFL